MRITSVLQFISFPLILARCLPDNCFSVRALYKHLPVSHTRRGEQYELYDNYTTSYYYEFLWNRNILEFVIQHLVKGASRLCHQIISMPMMLSHIDHPHYVMTGVGKEDQYKYGSAQCMGCSFSMNPFRTPTVGPKDEWMHYSDSTRSGYPVLTSEHVPGDTCCF